MEVGPVIPPNVPKRKIFSTPIIVTTVLISIFLLPVLVILFVSWYQKTTLEREYRSIESYKLFSSWEGTSGRPLTSINIFCLDQCSSVSGKFISKPTGEQSSIYAEAISFLKSNDYEITSKSSGCEEPYGTKDCTVYASKGSLKFVLDVNKNGGYTSFSVSY